MTNTPGLRIDIFQLTQTGFSSWHIWNFNLSIDNSKWVVRCFFLGIFRFGPTYWLIRLKMSEIILTGRKTQIKKYTLYRKIRKMCSIQKLHIQYLNPRLMASMAHLISPVWSRFGLDRTIKILNVLTFCKVYLQYVINYHNVVTQQGLLSIRQMRTIKDEMGIWQNESLTWFLLLSFMQRQGMKNTHFSVALQIEPYLVWRFSWRHLWLIQTNDVKCSSQWHAFKVI